MDGDDTVQAVKAGVEFMASQSGKIALVAEKRRLVMRFSLQSDASPKAARLRELLRLDPGRRRFDFVAAEDSELDLFQPDQVLGEVAIDAKAA